MLTVLGPLLGVLVGFAASPLQERWAREREQRAAERATTERQEAAQAEGEREDREAAAALEDRHRREARALLSALGDLARMVREIGEKGAGLPTDGPEFMAPRRGMHQALRAIEDRSWDLLLDCPAALATTTAAAMTRARVIFDAAMQGTPLISREGENPDRGFQPPTEAADDLSRTYGDACRTHFLGEAAGSRLHLPAPSSPASSVRVVSNPHAPRPALEPPAPA